MIYIQKWKNSTFEADFLNKVSQIFNNKENKKVYFGFDYGFFNGINIYYGSLKDESFAKRIASKFNDKKLNLRLYCNIDYDFDIIILFGYANLKKQRHYLRKNQKKIMEVLSSF